MMKKGTMENETKYHILMLSDNDKQRLTYTSFGIIEILENDCKSKEEQAFVLKMLVESFHDITGKRIPIESKE